MSAWPNDWLDRRRFLQWLSGSGALALTGLGSILTLGACSRSDAAPRSPYPPDGGEAARPIVVIGAGMAGLAAARALHDAGLQVIVLEARDRVGGRTYTADVGPARVDLGGAWIHGDRGNPVAELARARGLALTAQEMDFDAFYDKKTGWLDDEEIAVLDRLESLTGLAKLYFKVDDNASFAEAARIYVDGLDFDETNRRRALFALEILGSATGAPLDELAFWPLL